jgi:hypothetical protein
MNLLIGGTFPKSGLVHKFSLARRQDYHISFRGRCKGVKLSPARIEAGTWGESLNDYLNPQSLRPCQGAMGMLQNKFMVGVAQLAEHRVVAPAVAGSSPVVHPRAFEGLNLFV